MKDPLYASDTLYVVETDDDIFIGTVEFWQGGVIVRNGFRGHPHNVAKEDLVSMTRADQHPAVERNNPKSKAKSDEYFWVG